jgi:hypothetical protein
MVLVHSPTPDEMMMKLDCGVFPYQRDYGKCTEELRCTAWTHGVRVLGEFGV